MSLPSSMADFVPCDRLLQKVYSPFKSFSLFQVLNDFWFGANQLQIRCLLTSDKGLLRKIVA